MIGQKDIPEGMGVYVIINQANGRFYIGSSNNLPHRYQQHCQDLKSQTHSNSRLQRCWNDHTPSDFRFQILEMVEDRDSLLDREIYWMKEHGIPTNPLAYNKYLAMYRPPKRKTFKGVKLGASLSSEARALLTKMAHRSCLSKSAFVENLIRRKAKELGIEATPEEIAELLP